MGPRHSTLWCTIRKKIKFCGKLARYADRPYAKTSLRWVSYSSSLYWVFAQCHFGEYLYEECHHVEWHCTECHYVDCAIIRSDIVRCHYEECVIMRSVIMNSVIIKSGIVRNVAMGIGIISLGVTLWGVKYGDWKHWESHCEENHNGECQYKECHCEEWHGVIMGTGIVRSGIVS